MSGAPEKKKRNLWFRFYSDSLNDIKCLKLSDRTFRVWVGLLCLASRSEGQSGNLPQLKEASILLRMTPAALAAQIEILISATLIDRTESGLKPHNWDTRQFKSDVSTERVKRFRNGLRNVPVTAPESREQITEKKKESKEGPPVQVLITAPPAVIPLDDGASEEDQFWRLAPAAAQKGIARSQMGKLANLCGGDFGSALRIATSSMAAKVPSAYFSKVLKGVEAERMAPQIHSSEAGEPEFVRRYRRGGYPVEKLPNGRWRCGGREFNTAGEDLDG